MRLKISDLKQDYTLYPRQYINSYHVKEFVEALESGAKFPPIIVEAKTLRIVDGFHRVEAYRKHWGDTAEIEADVKEYAGDIEFYSEVISINSKHGQGLTEYDKANAIVKAESLGMTIDTIAPLLQMTIEKIGELRQERYATYQMQSVTLKGSIKHLAGTELDDNQMNYVRHAGGRQQTFYINQIIAMIESDSVDWNNEKVMNLLRKLHELLSGKLLVNS